MSTRLEKKTLRKEYGLTPEQVEFYEENGYVGPLDLCSEEEMLQLRDWLDESGIFTPGGVSPIYGSAISGTRTRARGRSHGIRMRVSPDICFVLR